MRFLICSLFQNIKFLHTQYNMFKCVLLFSQVLLKKRSGLGRRMWTTLATGFGFPALPPSTPESLWATYVRKQTKNERKVSVIEKPRIVKEEDSVIRVDSEQYGRPALLDISQSTISYSLKSTKTYNKKERELSIQLYAPQTAGAGVCSGPYPARLASMYWQSMCSIPRQKCCSAYFPRYSNPANLR